MDSSDTKNVDLRFAYPNWQGPFVWYGGPGGDKDFAADFAVIDVETTGLDTKQGARIIELSAIRTNGSGDVLDSITSLINPNIGTTGAEFIHGISLEMLAEAPSFIDIWPHLAQILNGAVFVAHHAKFDESFIASEAKIANIDLQMMPGLCTYRLAKDSMSQTANHKLATLSEYYGLNSGTMHSAYDDALTVVQLLPHLLPISGKINHYINPVQHLSGPISKGLVQRTN